MGMVLGISKRGIRMSAVGWLDAVAVLASMVGLAGILIRWPRRFASEIRVIAALFITVNLARNLSVGCSCDVCFPLRFP